MSLDVNPVQMSANDPLVTPIGAVGNGWMMGSATPRGPMWMWAEVFEPSGASSWSAPRH